MQLPHAQLDNCNILTDIDLEEEIGRSCVHNHQVKRRLIDLFHQVLKLCSILTDLLSIIGYSKDPFNAAISHQVSQSSVDAVKRALESWYGEIQCQFPECKHQNQSDIITIYSSWLHMLYQYVDPLVLYPSPCFLTKSLPGQLGFHFATMKRSKPF